MGIACSDYDEAERIDAATLPPFSNASRYPACYSPRARVCYSPGSATVRGPHFKRPCLRCGFTWHERATGART
jgi:hypothetical protein